MLDRVKRFLQNRHERVRLTGRHYRNARRLLLYTVDLLNEIGVAYHAMYGTLLGLARDGDLIPWDIDVDIMIPNADVEAFRKTFWSYRLRGWRVTDRYAMVDDYAAWSRGDPSSIKIRCPPLLDLVRGPVLRTGRKVMDVYIRYPDGDCFAWDTFGMISRAPNRFFRGYETIEYARRKVHVPRDYEALLELVYGDWRTPNPDYNAKRDDGTVVREPRWSPASLPRLKRAA